MTYKETLYDSNNFDFIKCIPTSTHLYELLIKPRFAFIFKRNF